MQRFITDLIQSISINPMSYNNNSGAGITREAALVFGAFYIFFLTTFILGLNKIKRLTYKVIGIIAIIISAGMLIWDMIMFNSPSHISFSEVAPAKMLYSPFILAFSIVGLIQAIRANRPNEKAQARLESDLLDS